MKNTLYLVAVTLFLTFSCVPERDEPVTEAEKELLKAEVDARINEIVATSNQMDLEAIKEIYWDSPQFLAVSFDKTLGYEAYMEDTEEVWSGMSSIQFEESDKQITILDRTTAYAVFTGSATGKTTKEQELRINDFFASMLLKKLGQTWKVVGTHESGTFVMVEQDSTAAQ